MAVNDNWKSFVSSERHNYIRFDEGSTSFKLKGKNGVETTLPGLHKYLKKVFYPDYEYIRRKGDGTTGAGSLMGGLTRGKNVHDELMHFANMSKKEFEKAYKNGDIEVYTAKTILSLREWGLKPVCSEVCVWNQSIATRIDCIATNEDGELILIEWKTGMDNYFERGNTSMHGILKDKFSNCPMNQAHLQLLISRMMIEVEYKTKVDRQYVINIHGDGVNAYELPERMYEMRGDIYKFFMYRVNTLKSLQQSKWEQDKKTAKKRRRGSGKGTKRRKTTNGYVKKKPRNVYI
jgi:hypothetical protein